MCALILLLLLPFACTPRPTPQDTSPIAPIVEAPPQTTATAQTGPTATATATAVTSSYTVQPGDTLTGIAARFGTSVQALQAANGITDPSLLQAGQTLRIPASGEVVVASAPTATATVAAGGGTYPVQAGDTLTSIAARFGTTVAAIQAANGIADPSLIRIGQTLRIPGAGEALPTPAPSAPPAGGTTAPTATPRPPTPVPAPVVSSGFGYGMQVDPATDLNRALGMITDAGFGWAKAQLRWESIEGSKGAINWGYTDNIVNAAKARGVRLLFSIVTAPAWSRPSNTDFSVPGPPANPQDYADFVGAIAARYPSGVDAIEVWNEQNLWYEWGGAGKMNAGEYVALLKLAHGAIKANNANITVVTGAPTPAGNVGNQAIDDVQYFGQMYAAGAKGFFDAVGVHPSGFNNPPDDDPGTNSTPNSNFKGHWSFYFRNFENYRNVMVNNGDGGKKLWITESGWAAAQGAAPPADQYGYATQLNETLQAQYLARAYEMAAAKGYVGAMFLWNLNFAPSAEADDRFAKRAFSVIQTTWAPRSGYCSLAGIHGRKPTGC